MAVMMTYAQRQVLHRILYWIGVIFVIVCGIYILCEAYLCENSPVCSNNAGLSLTYLMGRCLSQIAAHATYSGFLVCFCYRYLLLSDEDRAPVETDSSESDCQDTAAGWCSVHPLR